MRQKQQNQSNSCGSPLTRYVDNACPNAGETCDSSAPNYCKPPTISCNGSVGGGCNASSPPANGFCSAAPACNNQCNANYIWNGAACVTDIYTLWSCIANNTRSQVGSCNGSPAYAGSTTYGLNQVACQPNNNPNPNPTNCVVCSASMGNSCQSPTANNCGDYRYGTIQCDGSCSATTPPADRSPGPPSCSCAGNNGQPCSASNTCSPAATNYGTYNCVGVCSAVAPPNICTTPIDGVCGSTLNSCNTSPGQSASNIASNTTTDTWDCNGWYGGDVAHCSKSK
jgi:hypothetical protein